MKARLIKEGGGTEDSEKAVALGLAWLAKQQKKDGSWEYDVEAKDYKAAATGMGLPSFHHLSRSSVPSLPGEV